MHHYQKKYFDRTGRKIRNLDRKATWNENVEMWREEATSIDDEEALSDLSI